MERLTTECSFFTSAPGPDVRAIAPREHANIRKTSKNLAKSGGFESLNGFFKNLMQKVCPKTD